MLNWIKDSCMGGKDLKIKKKLCLFCSDISQNFSYFLSETRYFYLFRALKNLKQPEKEKKHIICDDGSQVKDFLFYRVTSEERLETTDLDRFKFP